MIAGSAVLVVYLSFLFWLQDSYVTAPFKEYLLLQEHESEENEEVTTSVGETSPTDVALGEVESKPTEENEKKEHVSTEALEAAKTREEKHLSASPVAEENVNAMPESPVVADLEAGTPPEDRILLLD